MTKFALLLKASPIKEQEWLTYAVVFNFDTETKTVSAIFAKDTACETAKYSFDPGVLSIQFEDATTHSNESLHISLTKSQYKEIFTQQKKNIHFDVSFRSQRFYNKIVAGVLSS